MARGIVKGFGGVFLNRTNLMAVICILSFVAGVAYTKSGRQITFFNAIVTESDADTQPSLNETEIKASSMPDSGYSILDKHEVQNTSETKNEQSGQ